MPDELILFDFESDGELDEVHWKCYTLMSIGDQHHTHGNNSLKMESLITSGTKRKMNSDEIERFLFFIYKPGEKVVLYVDYIRLAKS